VEVAEEEQVGPDRFAAVGLDPVWVEDDARALAGLDFEERLAGPADGDLAGGGAAHHEPDNYAGQIARHGGKALGSANQEPGVVRLALPFAPAHFAAPTVV
jgi:hypothetical protein